MILDFISDGEFAMSEFGDLEYLALLMFGMMYLVLLFWLLWFVVVCGGAVVIRRAHIHCSRVFTGSAAIWGHSTGPAFTIAGGGPVSVLQGFIFDVGVGVRGEAPDPGDLLVHFGS
jgi:hypothetical protein